MVFALPLPLGIEGRREALDIKIDETQITMEEVRERLSRTPARYASCAFCDRTGHEAR